MRLPALVSLVLITAIGCGGAKLPDARTILDRSVAAHGGEALDSVTVTFKFRDRQFRLERNHGLFRYERWYSDSMGVALHDVLTNDGLYREQEGEIVPLDSASRASAETGVNSVAYFALLPYPLSDPAVRTRYLGEVVLEGERYHKVEVTFVPEGGGRDFDDRFVYWISADTDLMDYLAYYYHTNDTGSRFRKAVNRREVGGFLFADYLNYKAVDPIGMDAVEQYDSLFEAGAVELVSEILLENLAAERNAPQGD